MSPPVKPVNLMSHQMYNQLIKAVGWLYNLEKERVDGKGLCDPYCPGWGVFDSQRGMGLNIQRCDVCRTFPHDDAAYDWVMKRLGSEMEKLHRHEVDRYEKKSTIPDGG